MKMIYVGQMIRCEAKISDDDSLNDTPFQLSAAAPFSFTPSIENSVPS